MPISRQPLFAGRMWRSLAANATISGRCLNATGRAEPAPQCARRLASGRAASDQTSNDGCSVRSSGRGAPRRFPGFRSCAVQGGGRGGPQGPPFLRPIPLRLPEDARRPV